MRLLSAQTRAPRSTRSARPNWKPSGSGSRGASRRSSARHASSKRRRAPPFSASGTRRCAETAACAAPAGPYGALWQIERRAAAEDALTSFLKFRGEDPGKAERERLQHEQQRLWLQQHLAEKERQEQEQRRRDQ
jgi:hypothetical protein